GAPNLQGRKPARRPRAMPPSASARAGCPASSACCVAQMCSWCAPWNAGDVGDAQRTPLDHAFLLELLDTLRAQAKTVTEDLVVVLSQRRAKRLDAARGFARARHHVGHRVFAAVAVLHVHDVVARLVLRVFEDL